jgi:WXG100 family type VII secretion target
MVAFTVTPDDLNHFATYCDNQAQDIGMAVRTLSTQVEELCSSPYAGPASNQLLQDMLQVQTETMAMQTQMSDITANLRNNAVVYSNGETQNVSNLQAATAAIAAGNAAH